MGGVAQIARVSWIGPVEHYSHPDCPDQDANYRVVELIPLDGPDDYISTVAIKFPLGVIEDQQVEVGSPVLVHFDFPMGEESVGTFDSVSEMFREPSTDY